MEILTQKQIDELAEKYPLDSQKDTGLDAVVCCKLLFPDRRNNPEGYWYITGCSRVDDDVIFSGLCTVAGVLGFNRISPVHFRLSGLNEIISRDKVIEMDKDFKPATVRVLGDVEAPLKSYVRGELEKERRTAIWASRQDVADTIVGLFLGLDSERGTASRTIAEELANDVCNDMIGSRKERGPAILRVIARRLGIRNNIINKF